MSAVRAVHPAPRTLRRGSAGMGRYRRKTSYCVGSRRVFPAIVLSRTAGTPWHQADAADEGAQTAVRGGRMDADRIDGRALRAMAPRACRTRNAAVQAPTRAGRGTLAAGPQHALGGAGRPRLRKPARASSTSRDVEQFENADPPGAEVLVATLMAAADDVRALPGIRPGRQGRRAGRGRIREVKPEPLCAAALHPLAGAHARAHVRCSPSSCGGSGPWRLARRRGDG